jgi:hypothetical protein
MPRSSQAPTPALDVLHLVTQASDLYLDAIRTVAQENHLHDEDQDVDSDQ